MKKIIGYAIAGFFILGALPLLLRVLGIYFIPASTWIQTMAWPASIFGVVVGAVTMVFVVTTRDSNPQVANASAFKLGLVSVGTFLLTWMTGFFFVAVSLPMAHATLFGEDEMRLAYTVKDPRDSGSRRCRPATELADMVFMVNELCGTPRALTDNLTEGDTVYAVGRGSSMGVFYDSFSFR